VPPVEHVHERVPVSKVGLIDMDRCEEHDVRKGDGHAAASMRMVHVLHASPRRVTSSLECGPPCSTGGRNE
jgi:hypothetical protein